MQKIAAEIRSIFFALLIAGLFRSTVVQAFTIPSGSATPTLLTGDSVMTTKFAYGYSRYSLPWAPAFLHGRLFGADPKRGDMAVFANPHDGVITIKRIVGLPGDRIQVQSGILFINGTPCPRVRDGEFVERDWDEATATPIQVLRYQYRETLPGGLEHQILGVPVSEPEDSGPVDSTGEYMVPAGHYFGMGDSRDNSADSRFLDQLGYIPAENLIGRADLRLVSFDAGVRAWQFWKWPTAIRFNRFFGVIR
jgi:signal peptidase I